MRRVLFGMGLSSVVAFMGCGGVDDAPEKYAVTGTVTFEGSPVEEGQIIFRPPDDQGHSFAGPIKDGRFAFESTEGAKRVEITAYRKDETQQMDDPAGSGKTVAARKAYIPAKYNTETTLTADVAADSANQYEFDLVP